MWMVCVRFVDETAIIKGKSIEIVIENICLYFHRTWKHSSSDIEEFWRNVYLSKTSDFRGGGYRFFMFQVWLSGLLLRRSVQTSYLDNFHCSWIVNGILGHCGQNFTCYAYLYSGHFQNEREYSMRCNMCSVDANCPISLSVLVALRSLRRLLDITAGYHLKLTYTNLIYTHACALLMVTLYFTHQIIS